jgi:uncharacterized protein YkwD
VIRAALVSLVVIIAAVAQGAFAQAAPALRYNAPLPSTTPRHPLAARVEALVAQVAREERREPPRPDARLAEAALAILQRMPPDGRPANELVASALWLHGLVEPPPHLIVATIPDFSPTATMGGRGFAAEEEALVRELRAQLPSALRDGRYRRVGVALGPRGADAWIVVALQESAIELDPVPRALPNGGPTPLSGRLLPPFERPEGFVTGPDGKVSRLSLGTDPRRLSGTFHCGPTRGRYQVELTGEDRFGPSVLANFPIYCGREAPTTVEAAPARPEDRPPMSAAAAEAEIARLVNADRARAGLPPLTVDANLAAVARAHSEDMRDHHFVGHVSPTTGSAADRLRRVGIMAQLMLENVARAFSSGEAERGLMESPGHRGNILHRDVTRLGVGVALADAVGGGKELFVTQLFTRPMDRVDAGSEADVRRRLDAARAGRRLAPLGRDATLEAIARGAADALSRGAGQRDVEALVGRELGRTGATRGQAVSSVIASGTSVAQLASSVIPTATQPRVVRAGMALAQGVGTDGAPVLYLVCLFGSPP